jgi:acyl carrier protein
MKEKLIKSLAEALEMDVSLIRVEDIFRDYENYSSLTELSVLAMLNSDFGIEIEMKDFNKYITVEDLISLVNGGTVNL